VLQCIQVRSNVLQYVAVCCSVLHCVSVCCSLFCVLQCVVVCCSASQCVAVCSSNAGGSGLQCVAVRLQHVAVRYSAVQCGTVTYTGNSNEFMSHICTSHTLHLCRSHVTHRQQLKQNKNHIARGWKVSNSTPTYLHYSHNHCTLPLHPTLHACPIITHLLHEQAVRWCGCVLPVMGYYGE